MSEARGRVGVAGPCLAAAVLLGAAPASACGVSASGVASCNLAEHEEATRPRWAVGASGVYTSTALRFSGSVRADQTRYAALAAVAYMPRKATVLQAGVGATFGGSLVLPDGRYELSPGPTASLGADYRLFDDGRFFSMLSGTLSFSWAQSSREGQPSASYTAFDLRVGGSFGVNIEDRVRPYALARVFGGPIFWHYQGDAVSGTDVYHYQLGAGLGLALTRSLNAFAEGVPLGERAIALGLGASF